MRVDQAVTYDISRGKDVLPIGMTRSGNRVFFTTGAKLTVDDTDTSTDLYMWEEGGATGTLTRVSQGNGEGNSDACNPSWGVERLRGRAAHPRIRAPGQEQDDQRTRDGRPPRRSERRHLLLLAGAARPVTARDQEPAQPLRLPRRSGAARRHLRRRQPGDPDADLARRQPRRSGHRLAPLPPTTTKASTRSTPTTPTPECCAAPPASRPASRPPTTSGRARAAASCPTTAAPSSRPKTRSCPRDQNGKIIDIYEYVDGRPQLISSGLGSRDFTGGSDVLNLSFTPEHIGLEHVSRDGTDVYFSTFETLVNRDFNGEFVKFYDARTGGGFPEDPVSAPCAAADECHGVDSAEPAAPVINSGGNLGDGGNQATAKKPRRRARRRRRRRASGRSAAVPGRSGGVPDDPRGEARAASREHCALLGLLAALLAGPAQAYENVDPGFNYFKATPTTSQAGGHPNVSIDFEYRIDNEARMPRRTASPAAVSRSTGPRGSSATPTSRRNAP